MGFRQSWIITDASLGREAGTRQVSSSDLQVRKVVGKVGAVQVYSSNREAVLQVHGQHTFNVFCTACCGLWRAIVETVHGGDGARLASPSTMGSQAHIVLPKNESQISRETTEGKKSIVSSLGEFTQMSWALIGE